MLARDRADDRQPEARARPRVGEPHSRLEDALEVVRREAVALVADLDHDRLPVTPGRQGHRASGGRVADRIRDEVGERLPEPVRVAVHGEAGFGLGDHHGATECRRLGGVPGEPARVEPLEPEGVGSRVGEESLEPRHRCAGELQQAPPPDVVGRRVGVGNRDERRHGASHLVREHGKPVGAHRTLSLICAPAQAAASASTGSSLAAHSSRSGSASPAPVLPSA